MSHQAVNWAIQQRVGGPSAKTVLWSIANYADEHWCCWPSQERISQESEQSPDTVQRRIRLLEETGFVRRVRLRFAGRRSTNFYLLQPSPYFSAPISEFEHLFPRGYVVDHEAAVCGLDDAANDAANDAALLRSQNLGTLEDGGGKSARAREEPLVKPEAFALAERIASIAGHPDPQAWPPTWCGAPMRVQAMLDRGWQAEIMIATAQSVMSRKSDGPPESIGYFEKPFARAHAQNSKPFPTVTEGSSPHAQSRKGGFADALARLTATIESRERTSDGIPESGPRAAGLITDGRG